MPNSTQTISSAEQSTKDLIKTIEARPTLDQQARTMISTLNTLLQKLSDLGNERTRVGVAIDLHTNLQRLYIYPLETFVSANLAMQKLGQLNTAKTATNQQLGSENALAKALIEALRQLLSDLGGAPFVPDDMPPGPIVP
ncbi:hypothetical protein [Thalassospira tepidiphila]|uniref:hypothetical protein n=1 Tax=Thalassospira tepidiphila TaxID=393657 RepID=UPI00291D292A|nr:hypothetical protein MACH01_23710 [Thalassospira tepidiphila]